MNNLPLAYDTDDVLEHYGIPRRSGRYPWGSGDNPYHHGAASPGGAIKSKGSGGSRKGLTDKQKKALKIGAAAAAAALAVAGTVYLAKTGRLDALASIGKGAVNRVVEKSRSGAAQLKENRNELKEAKRKFKEAAKEIRRDRRQALKNRKILPLDEVNERINRLNKEKELKNLIRDDLYPGRKEMNDALSSAGKRVITGTAAGTGLVLTEYLVRKHFNDPMPKEELAKATKDYMRPKKK